MDKKHWDTIFENYDSEIFDVLKRDKTGIAQSWLAQVASKKKTVADFGCGIGKWIPSLAKQFKEVSAIDFSSANMAFNEKKFKHLSNVNYHTIDMTKILKSTLRFDVILCVAAILNAEYSKRKNFITNIYTSLKSKGQLILVVPSFESALFSAFTLEEFNRKTGFPPKYSTGKMRKDEYEKFKQGVVVIDYVPTKHYLKEELISTLRDTGFEINKIDKVEFPWSTEIDNPPASLKGPYPWDWIVMATKK